MEETKNLSVTEANVVIPQLNSESVGFLLKAAKWGKFLAILGFIVTGLILIAGILMSFVLNMVQDEMVPLNMPFPPKVLSIIYVIIAGIYIIPVIYLNSFCNNAIKAVTISSTEHLTKSIRNLRNLFVFFGISTIIILTIYTIVLIIAGSAAILTL
jgi:hypothetical protein